MDDLPRMEAKGDGPPAAPAPPPNLNLVNIEGDAFVEANPEAARIHEFWNSAPIQAAAPALSDGAYRLLHLLSLNADPKALLAEKHRLHFPARAHRLLELMPGRSRSTLYRLVRELRRFRVLRIVRVRTKTGHRKKVYSLTFRPTESVKNETNLSHGGDTKKSQKWDSITGARKKGANFDTGAGPKSARDRALFSVVSPVVLEQQIEEAAKTISKPADLENVKAVLRFLADPRSRWPKQSVDSAMRIILGMRSRRYLGDIAVETWLRVWTFIIVHRGRETAIATLIAKLAAGEWCDEYPPYGHPATQIEDVEERRRQVNAAKTRGGRAAIGEAELGQRMALLLEVPGVDRDTAASLAGMLEATPVAIKRAAQCLSEQIVKKATMGQTIDSVGGFLRMAMRRHFIPDAEAQQTKATESLPERQQEDIAAAKQRDAEQQGLALKQVKFLREIPDEQLRAYIVRAADDALVDPDYGIRQLASLWRVKTVAELRDPDSKMRFRTRVCELIERDKKQERS